MRRRGLTLDRRFRLDTRRLGPRSPAEKHARPRPRGRDHPRIRVEREDDRVRRKPPRGQRTRRTRLIGDEEGHERPEREQDVHDVARGSRRDPEQER